MATRKPRRQSAVIDRVEEGTWAVLLVGRNELEKIVHVDHLPKEARAGMWLKVRLQDDAVRDIEVDEAATQAATTRVRSKLELLRSRGGHFRPSSSAAGEEGTARPTALTSAADAPTPAPTEDMPKLLTGPVEEAAPSSDDADVDDETGDDMAGEEAEYM